MQHQTLEKVIHEINDIPEEKVSTLIDFIHFLKWDSSHFEYEEEWDTEIARRVEEIKSGKAKGIPAEEAYKAIEARLS